MNFSETKTGFIICKHGSKDNTRVILANLARDLPLLQMLHPAIADWRYAEQCLFFPSGNSQPIRPADIQLRLPRVQPDYTPRALPVRTERHNPHSIATLRRQIATHLARSLRGDAYKLLYA
jgi:hypothetical protein